MHDFAMPLKNKELQHQAVYNRLIFIVKNMDSA